MHGTLAAFAAETILATKFSNSPIKLSSDEIRIKTGKPTISRSIIFEDWMQRSSPLSFPFSFLS